MASKVPARRSGHASLHRAPKRSRRYRPAPEACEPRQLLTGLSLFVTTLTDSGTGSGNTGDLRYCIGLANSSPGSTIYFQTSGTDTLSSSLPDISADTAIYESTPGAFIVSGGGTGSNYKALTIDNGVTAAISGVNFTNFAYNGDGAILAVEGTLTLNNASLSNSSAGAGGGAVFIDTAGSLTANQSTFNSNTAAGSGGAIESFGNLNLSLDTIENNSAGSDGGGVYDAGDMDANGVLFFNNSATSDGGAIYSTPAMFPSGLTITDSTIASNTAGTDGAGLDINSVPTTLTNDTIANNLTATAGATGAGVYVTGSYDPLLKNTLIAQNTAGIAPGAESDFDGSSSIDPTSSYNLLGNSSVSGISDGSNGNRIGTALSPLVAQLAPLSDNGGNSYTIALNANSPALGAGLVANAVDPVTTLPLQYDQRGIGFPRIVNNAVDIGAFQSQVASTTLSVASATGVYGGTITVSATLTSGGNPVGNEQVDFHLGTIDLGYATTDNVTGIASLSNIPLGTLNATTYTGEITASFAGDSSFGGSNGSADLTVNQAPLTITANSTSKTYGSSITFAGTEFTVSPSTPLFNSDAVTGVSLASAGAAATADVAGSPYAIVPSGATGAGLGNYAITYVNGSLTVDQAPLTITANSTSKTYGSTTTFAGTEFTHSTLYNGDAITGVTLTSAGAAAGADVAGSPYAIDASSATGTGVGNYAITYLYGSLAVNQAPLTITANSTSKTYGSSITFAGTEFTVSPSTPLFNSDAVTGVTLASAGAAATADVAGSPYGIVASAATGTGLDNYQITYVNGSLTVNQAPLAITANSTSKTYGGTITFAGTEFTTSTLFNSDTVTGVNLTSAGAAANAHVVGSPYAIAPGAAVGTGLGNYAITYVNGSLSVTPAPLTITADDKTKVYGDALPSLTASYSGLVNGDTPSSLSTRPTISTNATAVSDVTGRPYPITAGGAVDPDYSISYVPGNLTVTPAPLTIAVDNQTRVYGQPNPPLTGTLIGTVAGDDVHASYATAATQFSDVRAGGYPITVAGLTGTKAADYTTTNAGGSVIPGLLTITPAPLSVVVNNASRPYGAANPTLSGTIGGVLNGDDVSIDYVTPANASSHVVAGGYPILATQMTGAKAGDYVLSNSAAGTLTVTPVPLTIAAANATRVYGQPNPSFLATYRGFVLGQDAGALAGALGFSTPANARSHVGLYPVTPGGLSSADYAIRFASGTLAVTPAPLVVTPVNVVKAYGAPVPTLTAIYSGFVNGDSPSRMTAPVNLTTTATLQSAAGVYPITAKGVTSPDYAVSYRAGSVTVPAPGPSNRVAFVNVLYETILGRAAEPSGMTSWLRTMASGASPVAVFRQIYFSQEALALRASHRAPKIGMARIYSMALQALDHTP